MSHVPETITRLILGLNEVACLVPDSFYEVSLISSTHVEHDLECVIEKQFQDEFPTSTINVGMLAIVLVFLNTLKVYNE